MKLRKEKWWAVTGIGHVNWYRVFRTKRLAVVFMEGNFAMSRNITPVEIRELPSEKAKND